jgi:hypothetical protein
VHTHRRPVKQGQCRRALPRVPHELACSRSVLRYCFGGFARCPMRRSATMPALVSDPHLHHSPCTPQSARVMRGRRIIACRPIRVNVLLVETIQLRRAVAIEDAASPALRHLRLFPDAFDRVHPAGRMDSEPRSRLTNGVVRRLAGDACARATATLPSARSAPVFRDFLARESPQRPERAIFLPLSHRPARIGGACKRPSPTSS